MLDDLQAAGITVAPHADGEPLRLAELRAITGLKLPVLDITIHQQARLATFDDALAAATRQRGVPVDI